MKKLWRIWAKALGDKSGKNDKEADINALVNFCKKIPSKVNLIQYNSIDDPNFIQASDETLSKYISSLEKIISQQKKEC